MLIESFAEAVNSGKKGFDIYIRNKKMLMNVINYISQNPVKAGIVAKWEDYPWSYVIPGLV